MKNIFDRTLKNSLALFSVYYLLIYLVLVYFRIQYPFELEWMEGGAVDHVRRILDGKGLYVSPSIEFVPFIYTPLYYYIAAIVSRITGAGFFPLRLVSFLASIGCMSVIFALVKKETGRPFYALAAAGLFAATFRLSGAWFDIARIDSLFLFFLLAALYQIRFSKNNWSPCAAAFWITMAFFTKQTTLMIIPFVVIYYYLTNPKLCFIFTGSVTAFIWPATWAINYIHQGWFFYYIFDVPKQHQVLRGMLWFFIQNDLLRPLWIAYALATVHFFIGTHRKNVFAFYILMSIGMTSASLMSRLHTGGYSNVLFPAYAFIAILFGLSLKTILESRHTWIRWIFGSGCALQFLLVFYNPLLQIPSQKDVENGRKFISELSSIDGDVLVPYHGFLPAMANKKSYAQGMAVYDVARAQDQNGARLINEFTQAVKNGKFKAIVLDSNRDLIPWDLNNVYQSYKPKKDLFEDLDVYWPVTGMRTRPQIIYVRK